MARELLLPVQRMFLGIKQNSFYALDLFWLREKKLYVCVALNIFVLRAFLSVLALIACFPSLSSIIHTLLCAQFKQYLLYLKAGQSFDTKNMAYIFGVRFLWGCGVYFHCSKKRHDTLSNFWKLICVSMIYVLLAVTSHLFNMVEWVDKFLPQVINSS